MIDISTRKPEEGESYSGYLTSHGVLGHGFEYGELVRGGSERHVIPPQDKWERMVPTLRLANHFRQLCVDQLGCRGLYVRAAFRPRGGEQRSLHKQNAAIDLDLLADDYGKARHYYRLATMVWCDEGRHLMMGLGLYCPAGITGGIRVHMDTGWRARTWTHDGSESVEPPLAVSIARDLGLALPTDKRGAV